MTKYKYILRNLLFHWKKNLAVFAAILLSSAILSGALIIGDSVEMSLRNIVESRLGRVSYALISGERFVRSELALDIEKSTKADCAPILLLEGIAANVSENLRINKASVLGVDSLFWKLSNIASFNLAENEIVISHNLAFKLKLSIGDNLLLRMSNALIVPVDAPFSSTDNSETVLSLKIKYIATDKQLARFSLKNDQKSPFNIFIDRNFIAKNLKIENFSNAILISETNANVEKLDSILKLNWKLADAGLVFRDLRNNNDFELISSRVFIDNIIAEKLENQNISSTKNLTYLVNSLQFNHNFSPYSFVVATDIFDDLESSEIMVTDWLLEDLGAKIGDTICLNYFVINSLKRIEEAQAFFKIKAAISSDNEQIDSLLMPNFSGITESENCRDWETGIPIDLTKIRDKDEAYWNKFRGKPKAVISLKSGIKLWSNTFGNYTNLRFKGNEITKNEVEAKLMNALNPMDLGIQFYSVQTIGQRAVDNAVDFGGLFLSLSFFVIAGALLLLVIILKLNIDFRLHEVGILNALGLSKSQIVSIIGFEAGLIAFISVILGSFLGILYTKLLLLGLNSVWADIVRTDMLQLYILPRTIIFSILINFLIALAILFWVINSKLKESIIKQINVITSNTEPKNLFWIKISFFASVLLSFLLLSYIFANSLEISTDLLMLTSSFIFISLILAFYILMISYATKIRKTAFSFTGLIFKNLTKNKSQSLSIIILLALGAFTILVTASNRKTFFDSHLKNTSGTGGFLFWAQNTLPIEYDLNTLTGKTAYNLQNIANYNIEFLQFSVLEGDDASCLNLNQVSKPSIMGVNAIKLASRRSFSFSQSLFDDDKTWLVLEKEMGKDVIPAIADQTVITWGLMKSVGDTLTYLNEAGKELKLVLVASLNSSVFQGHILISDKIFSKNFPSSGGSKAMLIDGSDSKKELIADELNNALVDLGIELEPTNERLAEFNSVTNTYLTVFMILGSLGILIATIGMGTVLLRSVLQRKSELALMLAIGFSKKKVFRLIVSEYLILLLVGLFIGLFSALVGAIPSILSNSFSASWLFVVAVILLVFFNGWLWIYLAARTVIKSNLVNALRSE